MADVAPVAVSLDEGGFVTLGPTDDFELALDDEGRVVLRIDDEDHTTSWRNPGTLRTAIVRKRELARRSTAEQLERDRLTEAQRQAAERIAGLAIAAIERVAKAFRISAPELLELPEEEIAWLVAEAARRETDP